MDEMSRMHINTLHFNNLPDPRAPESALAIFANLARDRGIRLIPQFQIQESYPLYFNETSSLPLAQQAYNSAVQPYLTDPAILAWSVIEEVHSNGGYIERIRDLVHYIDEIPGHAHPGFVLWGSPYFTRYQPFSEDGIKTVQPGRIRPGIVGYDCYPFFKHWTWSESRTCWEDSINSVYNWSTPFGSPVWVLGQGIGNTSSWRFPTETEMFWQAWLAIVNGAKGIMYWTFASSSSINGFVSTSGQLRPHWQVMDDVWNDIAPFEKIIVDIDKSPTSIVTGTGTDIRAGTFQRVNGSERYLIVVNSHVNNSLPTGVSLSSGGNIYDLRTLDPTPITPIQLANVQLAPGRGNMYLVGTEDDFQYYIDNFVREPGGARNIMPDPSFESKGVTKQRRDLKVFDANGDGYLDGSIEITDEDSYKGRKSVHMYGEGVDYPRVYTDIMKETSLDEIISVSFWFKHLEGSDPNTPYAVMGFWIVGGDYDGGQLNLYQWYKTMPDLCDEWTLIDDDSWHYRVYIPGGGYFDDLGPYTLNEIQGMLDAVIFRAGVAMGASDIGFGDSADVYVDHFMVEAS